MKLVLLPGMDGTGILFENFIKASTQECLVIPLPADGKQDHKSLAEYIRNELPDDEFILLAESFSGGLVPHLLNQTSNRIRGVIFVASFLSSPNLKLMFLARIFPFEKMIPFWITKIILKKMFLDQSTTDDLLIKCVRIIRSVPKEILKKRLMTMAQMKLPEMNFLVPTVYIQAKNDRAVKAEKYPEFLRVFPNIQLYRISGPHFILQSNPVESAQLISEAILHLRR